MILIEFVLPGVEKLLHLMTLIGIDLDLLPYIQLRVQQNSI